jgi:hypothetical protein
MKTVSLVRGQSSDQGTFGVLTLGSFRCRTVELPWRDNLPQKSCIPTGSYTVKLVHSPKFGLIYGVQNVPGRANVLIHSANFGGNTDLGYTTQLHGCIAPCKLVGSMRNNAGVMQLAGLVSKPTLAALMSLLNKEPFTLEIS